MERPLKVEAFQKYSAPPTVAAMLRSNALVRCIVGPQGSGKSSGCVMELARRAREQAPNEQGVRRSRWAVIRNSYRELEDTTRKTFDEWIPASAGRWRESDFAFDLTGNLKDGTKVEAEILFRSLNKPGDTKKLLSLELTGAYINEAKEIPQEILTALKGRIGRFPRMADGGPTWRGIWMDTNPWPMTHWGYKLFKNPPQKFELFKQPGGRSAKAENIGNLVPDYYADLVAGSDAEWVLAYVDGEYPAAQQGAIFAQQIEALEAKGAIKAFEHPDDGVFTSWDLGFTDSTAIWFWRLNGKGGLDFIDHYENHGQPLSHYFDVIDGRAFRYVRHWLPHDAAARTLAASISIQDQFMHRYGGTVSIGPALSLLDGIQASRWLLEQACRFHARTSEGVEALRAYHYAWDDDTKTYSRKPEHDWSSHTADAFRYAAVVAKYELRLGKAKEPKKPPVIPSVDKAWHLDQLFEMNETPEGRKRI